MIIPSDNYLTLSSARLYDTTKKVQTVLGAAAAFGGGPLTSAGSGTASHASSTTNLNARQSEEAVADDARCEDARRRIEAIYSKFAPERLAKVCPASFADLPSARFPFSSTPLFLSSSPPSHLPTFPPHPSQVEVLLKKYKGREDRLALAVEDKYKDGPPSDRVRRGG